MKPIAISKVEDTKSKILVSLYNSQRPLRLSEISKSSKMSLKLVDYHIKGLMEKEIVFCNEEEDSKTYRLADSYYDDTFMETLEEYFTPIAETFAKLNPDIKTTDGVIENLKASMELFCDSNRK
jgi:DNA-binding transcriptional regulator GbsR (MarR family)